MTSPSSSQAGTSPPVHLAGFDTGSLIPVNAAGERGGTVNTDARSLRTYTGFFQRGGKRGKNPVQNFSEGLPPLDLSRRAAGEDQHLGISSVHVEDHARGVVGDVRKVVGAFRYE